MIGDIVGGAHEIVECQDRGPVALGDEHGGDGKILVMVALARGQCGGVFAHVPAIAWARPFHMPPRPRQNCTAESMVNPT